jgi:hypothetical protein
MRVAIVTPYFKEPRAVLSRCIESVRAQRMTQHSIEVEHILIADGHPQDWIASAGVRHLLLDRSHNDYGNTPRSIGGLLAASEGFDAVSFLDADNWYEPNHVHACVDVVYRAASPIDYVVARRRMVRQDGSVMPIAATDDASFEHVDTSCYMLLWGAFSTLGRWATMPKPLAIIGDRIFRLALSEAGLKFAATTHPTVNYLCTWSSLFEAIGEVPPAYAKANVDIAPTLRWIRGLDEHSRTRVERLVGYKLGMT